MTSKNGQFWVLFGSNRGSDQIRVARFDSATGSFGMAEPKVASVNPGYILFSPDHRFLYVANHGDAYERGVSGGVSAFGFDDRSGQLTLLDSVPSGGLEPCHLAFDRSRRHLFVANYSSGSFAIRAINPDGSLGDETAQRTFHGSSVDPDRQTRSYAHSSVLDPSGKFVLVCDLGADKVWILAYREATGELVGEPAFAAIHPGDGPRHMAFHPNGRWLYVDGEMGNSVTRFDWDAATGSATFGSRTSTVPAGFSGSSTAAELLLSDDGRHLYVTNRGDDSIVTMNIDATTGDPQPADFVPSNGAVPRNFEFSPDRRWAIVTNHDSNNFTLYAVDSATGRLHQHGDPIALDGPYCPRFAPVGE
jgi:6-phosphogluconolactonase